MKEVMPGEHRLLQRDEHRGASFVLALVIHLLLALFLVFSVQWHTQKPETVEVEMWGGPPPLLVQEQTKVPEAKVDPKPVVPKPKVEEVPDKKPVDIAQKTEKPVKPKPEEKPKPQPASQPKVEKKPPEPQRKIEEKKPQPKPEKPVKKPEESNLENVLLGAMEQQKKDGVPSLEGKPGGTGSNPKARNNTGPGAGAGSGNGIGDGYKDGVVQLIKRHLIYPDKADNNAKAKVKVFLLPDGTINDAKLIKAVGDPKYAEAALNAVMTTQKFPPQPGGKIFSGDNREWTLSFCAKEGSECKID